jgi:tetratricopeptide (TPR) repeat protein
MSSPAPSNHPSAADRLARLLRYVDTDPANPALRGEIAEACLSLGRADEALSHAQAGLRAVPGDAQLANAKARALMSLGRHAEAIPVLAALLQQRPDAHLAFNLAYAQLQSGDAKSAHDTLAPFASGEPEPALATLWVRCLHHLGELESAIAFARSHEARFASDAAFLAAAALAYFDGEAFEDADRVSRAALALEPGLVEGLMVRGSLALGRADAAAALADLAEAVRCRPKDGRALSGLGMAKLLAGDGAGARDALRQAVSLMPLHIGTWHALGWSCIVLKSLDEAADAMRHALDLDRNFGESHGAVAVVAALAGRREEAQAAIDRALGLDPRGLSARYAQMVLSGEAADPEKFDRAARRVLSSRSLPGGLTLADLFTRRS